MELCMAAQEDDTPWELPAAETEDPEGSAGPPQTLLNGRAHFSILGVVRRKPSRADAESTLSKSCSDKLALKQVTSILSFPTSLLIVPTPNAYISNIILPEDELNRVGCDRSFGGGETGRMRRLKDQVWVSTPAIGGTFRFHPFTVCSLPMDVFEAMWKYGKPTGTSPQGNVKTGNVSAVWTAPPSYSTRPPFSAMGNQTPQLFQEEWHKEYFKTAPTNLNETLINGVKQGYRLNSPGYKKASALSRARMWALLRDSVQLLQECCKVAPGPFDDTYSSSVSECVLSAPTYNSLKSMSIIMRLSLQRHLVQGDARYVLQNWIRNQGDGGWGLDVFDIPAKAKIERSQPL
ncbi:tRNA-specific adenosine deaminase 1 [Arthroderma uncinatum]|uniref:tRNA-specific adenosine deaminase 1 n=1 Tax=Arthroderma uncinatum TaxID=74035 RepID=UPI00144ACD0D|nr:tRNA-specific adenosine deaminase 1 [Arthroderma uncinatum]KAF3491666.1 tRNA-specific adenosine deaminase 1 [Arthroderma uncinatum]